MKKKFRTIVWTTGLKPLIQTIGLSGILWNIWIDVKLLFEQRVVAGSRVYHQRRHSGFAGDTWPDQPCVPAFFIIFHCNGNRLSQEPACRTIGFCFSYFAAPVVAICQLISSSTGHGVPFRIFSGLFIDPFLSGVFEVFLRVKCIPHQNSQRLFWASVWLMLDSSRWHEPLGEWLV